MMRRFRHVLPSSALLFLTCCHREHHYKSLDNDNDPFGEKMGWDNNPSLGGWQNVDIDSLVEAMESPDVQRRHFGPDWSRARTLAREAVKQHGSFSQSTYEANDVENYSSDAARSLALEKARREKIEKDRLDDEQFKKFQEEVERRDKASESRGAGGGDDATPLSQKLSPRELAAAKVIMYDNSKMPSRNVEQEDYVSAPAPTMEQIAGYRAPEAMEIPKSIRRGDDEDVDDTGIDKKLADRNDDEDDDDDDESARLEKQRHKVERDSLGFPTSDPLHWDADDIVLWVENYGPEETDYDLLDAFKMSDVDGHFLLNKINPPDLFKLMRKWHLGGRTKQPTKQLPEGQRVPLISLTTIQEQAIMCFPYGPP